MVSQCTLKGFDGSVKVSNKVEQKKQKTQYLDYGLLAVVIFLVCFGLVMLYSTSYYAGLTKFDNGMYFFMRQCRAALLGLLGMIVVSMFPIKLYERLAFFAYVASVLILFAVWTPLGVEAYGARRWVSIPLLGTFQPAELTKVGVIIFIPILICKAGHKIKDFKVLIKIFICGAIAAAGVFFITDNLSSAIIVMGIVCVMIFVAHPKTGIWIALVGAVLAAALFAVRVLDKVMDTSSDFRLRRILVWLHPEQYSDDGGFQIMQGLYAIGSGGFFGKGLGNSAQKMVIPEVQNDMILSIICEELGVCGVIVLFTLFGMMLYRLMFIAQNAPTMYSSLVVTGIFAHIAIQVILNVCVVLNVIPTTGISLPFISYGGTALLISMAEIGVALGISRRIKLDEPQTVEKS